MSTTTPIVFRRLSAMQSHKIAAVSEDSPLYIGKHAIFSPADLTDVPPVVARYFHWALSDHQRLIRQAWIRSTGGFLIRPGGRWSAFSARQHFTVTPPEFVWNAVIYLMRIFPIRVRDSYVKGHGATRGRLLGVVPVVNQHGTTQLAEATLQRFLAEAIWFPTALLPHAGVSWTPIDETTARATLTDHGHTVSVDFHFDTTTGAITSVTAQRYRDVDGTMQITPWRTHVWDYIKVDGMMVPTNGVAEWDTPAGMLPYWRGRLFDFRYEFVR